MKTIAAVLVAALAPSSVLAQAAAAGHAEMLQSKPSTAGLSRSIAREATRLANDKLVETRGYQPQTAPQRSWAGRHPVALGAIIGVTGGAMWGASQCSTGCEGGAYRGPFIALGAGVGAAIGAGIGALVSSGRR